MEKDVEQLIIVKTSLLSAEFPIEANYGSRRSLWSCGLDSGIVSKELYDKAAEYYGKLWNYVGD